MTSIALVTGSSGGIGSEIARKLKGDGYDVVGLDAVDSDSVETLVCDLSEPNFHRVVNQFDYGKVSLIVHVAAHQPTARIQDLTREDWIRSLGVNVLALQELVAKYFSDLKSTRGTVIAISSVHAEHTSEKMAAYAASKAALNSWVRSAAIELGPEISVVGVAPGAIDTPKLREGMERWPPEERNRKLGRLIERTPIGRLGTAEEIAQWVSFLASPAGRFASGSVLALNGGVTGWLGTE